MPVVRKSLFARVALATVSTVFYHGTRMLPYAWCRPLGVALGRFGYRLLPRLHKVGRANIDLAYGDTLSDAEKERILIAAAENMCIVAAEFSHIPWLAKRKLAGRLEVEGEALVDWSKGVLLFGAHLGNWEAMAPAVASLGHRIAEVVRPLDNTVLNRLVDATRRGGGVGTIPKASAGKEMIRLLLEGCSVGVLVDQSPRINAVPVTFFGQPTWATIAPVMIAMRAEVPLHLVVLLRRPDGGYLLRFGPAIEIARTGNLTQNLASSSQPIQDMIEAQIRDYPEQWLWFHRRWKRRDALAKAWDEKLAKEAAAQREAAQAADEATA